MADDLKRRLRANRGEHSAIHVLSSLTEQKLSSRYPMRYVPDIPGFRTLTKQEIKRDARDIDKNLTFMHNNNDNDSDDETTGYVMSSMNPPCGDESHLFHKIKRLEKWKSNPNLKNKEIDTKKHEVNNAKKELDDLISEQDRWFFYLQLARLKLTESLMQCRDRNNHLIHDNKQLYNLSIVECGPSNRKRRSLAIRDILDDLVERENLLTSKINEYERVVAEASVTNTKYAGGFTLPITSISVDELDYEEDIKKIRSFKSDETILDGNSKTNDKVNSHEVSNSNKNVNKDNNKTETGDENIQIDLLNMFNSIEETIRLCQDTILNIDQFLPNDDEKEVTLNDTGISKRENGWVCNPGIEWEKKVANPIINIGEQEQLWSKTIDSMLSTQTRRKRRLQSGAPLPISSFVISRTPYDMPLLLSPLSQYEDRFIGTIVGDKNVINPDNINNKGLSYEEKKTVERCRIQSNAASAETKLRHLALANIEWSKQLNESKNALLRAEAIHEQAVQDDLLESKYIRKELISHGIAKSDPNDPPLSPLLPIETLRNNNLVNENNKAANFLQKGGTKRGCITINAKKNPIVYIQNYKAAAAATAVANMTTNETISEDNGEEVISTTVIENKKTTTLGDNKAKGGRRR